MTTPEDLHRQAAEGGAVLKNLIMGCFTLLLIGGCIMTLWQWIANLF